MRSKGKWVFVPKRFIFKCNLLKKIQDYEFFKATKIYNIRCYEFKKWYNNQAINFFTINKTWNCVYWKYYLIIHTRHKLYDNCWYANFINVCIPLAEKMSSVLNLHLWWLQLVLKQLFEHKWILFFISKSIV